MSSVSLELLYNSEGCLIEGCLNDSVWTSGTSPSTPRRWWRTGVVGGGPGNESRIVDIEEEGLSETGICGVQGRRGGRPWTFYSGEVGERCFASGWVGVSGWLEWDGQTWNITPLCESLTINGGDVAFWVFPFPVALVERRPPDLVHTRSRGRDD